MASTYLYAEALEKFQQAVLSRHRDIETQRLLLDFLVDGKSSFSTPDAARQAAAKLATDAGQKYGGGIKFGKHEVVPQKWVDAVLGNIDSIVVAGSLMMKNAPESVGMAWFAISLTLKAISNNYSLYALFGKGLTDITEVMIIITHYDRLYDERQRNGFKVSAMVDKLFRETIAAYTAVLDFSFSVKKHMAGGKVDKLRHGIKDFFNAQAPKFQGKLDNIALLKVNILESSQGAFQDKTMQQFEGVQAVLGQIQQRQSEALELQQEQTQVLNAMLEDFKELKDLVKRKTPWDFLNDEFISNKNKLAPLAGSHHEIDKLLASRQDGTCEWILTDEKYQSWKHSDRSAVLCISGGPGSGKSILLASLLQQFGASEDTAGPFINYVSCTTDDKSQTAAVGDLALVRVCNTLLFQIYALATIDSDKMTLLETCNQIFRNPKTRQAATNPGRGSHNDGDELPDFVEAMGKLVATLQRDTVIVIDAVGTLSQEDQVELYGYLQQLTTDPGSPKISVLVSSRSDSTFAQRSLSTTPCIDVSSGGKLDMEAVLDHRLKELPGWLDAERQLAKEVVLAKAGFRFDYINDVALPFLRQPFQRPVSNYLKRLPEGLNESFEQALRLMPQNYFELLQMSVSWCLLAPRMPTVKEVMEAYGGVYTTTEDTGILHETNPAEDAYDPKASELEVQQIREASGPFLFTEVLEDGEIIVKLQDARQVQKFCERTIENREVPVEAVTHVCENCKTSTSKRSSLAFDPKVAHFAIALRLLRHLNNPLFQRRFGLLDESESVNSESSSVGNEVNGSDVLAREEDLKAESGQIPANSSESVAVSEHVEARAITDAADQEASEETSAPTAESDVQGEIRQTDAEGNKEEIRPTEAEANKEEADEDLAPSVDEDVNDYDDIKDVPIDKSEPTAENYLYNYRPGLRCEIHSWPYHLLEAEKSWPIEERKSSETWIRLNSEVQQQLKKLVDNHRVFINWQKAWGGEGSFLAEENMAPLHLATYLGLTSWVESLLDDGADINEISIGCNVAQTSAILAKFHQNTDLLRLLLARGADFCKEQDNGYYPALHSWILNFNSPKTVEAFYDYDVDFRTKDFEGWTGLHAFSWTGFHVDSFNHIMNPKDPSIRPDINIVDENGQTPLHRLMWRRDVPLDLLKAFLAFEGINVNHDDKYSQMPLCLASTWGSVNVVRLLLEAGADVKDQDEDGGTAVHNAASGDHVKCLEALLEFGAEVDTIDKFGGTPLLCAAYTGRKAAVEFLVAKGADLNTTNLHNRTPFFNATRCLHGDHETAQFLLHKLKQAGYTASEINKITKGGRSPLRQACHRGFSPVVKDLLECIDESNDIGVKATINQSDVQLKRTPLHCAARRGEPECVGLLLKHGAETTLEDCEGKTALMAAQEQWAQRNINSFEEVVLKLMEQDHAAAIADAELPSIAAANGSVRVLQKLHSLRADLNRTDSLGWSPLAHAKHLGHKDAEFFLKHQSSWGGALPSQWVYKSSPSILDEQGLQVTYTADERICIISDKPLPPSVDEFYFEITLEATKDGSLIGIGFCTLGAEFHEFPGWDPKDTLSLALSWGYHADDGGKFHKDRNHTRDRPSEKYSAGDIVGCGVDLETHRMWFTKNGKKLDFQFENVRGRLYPILGMANPVTLTTNFGLKEFTWKHDQHHVTNGDSNQ